MAKDNLNQIEKELKTSIDLWNFEYSNSDKNEDCKTSQDSMLRFFGRRREKERLLDYLRKNKRGSYLIAGYRGVGKTRFVKEVLSSYKEGKRKENNNKVKDIYVNLGNDGDLNSKSVLFNMISLLSSEIENKNNFFSRLISKLVPIVIFSGLFLVTILSSIRIDEIPLILNCINPFVCFDFVYLWIALVVIFLFWMLSRDGISDKSKISKKLKSLQKEIYSTIDNQVQIKSNFFDYGKKVVTGPLTSNQIESRLIEILKEINKLKDNYEIIFVFDELDKLSGRIHDKNDVNHNIINDIKLRKQQVDSVLGDLKRLITDSPARYIFISGRDMYDAYLSERSSSNSLYESLFHAHIYIPSLLTDRSNGEVYLLDGMIEAFVVSNLMPVDKIKKVIEEKKKNCVDSISCGKSDDIDLSHLKLSDYKKYRKLVLIKQISDGDRIKCMSETGIDDQVKEELRKEIYILKTLIHFLALHSWGNCKRLFTLFEAFVIRNQEEVSKESKWKARRLWVNKHKPRLSDYKLYFSTQDIQRLVLSSQLYILFHHNLSRMLMNADDKLVVSSFSVFHYILKFHGIGFSKEHIMRMYETINIHSSPELSRIVDIIIHNVLLNHVRKVRHSFYQYRFIFLHEKEIHFITTINDGESAAFNFSLNAMDAVKQHYKNLIFESMKTNTEERYGHNSLAAIHVIVGNFHFWEQAFDEAVIHYGTALDILEKNGALSKDSIKDELVLQIVEICLKQGAAAERVGNYPAAAAIYSKAEVIANQCLEKLSFDNKDSKWGILRQPRWARMFLNLKQSAIHYKEKIYLKPGEVETDVSMYRKAVLSFFMDDFSFAHSGFLAVTNFSNRDQDTERVHFLKGNAYLKAGFSLALNYSSKLHEKLRTDLNHIEDVNLPSSHSHKELYQQGNKQSQKEILELKQTQILLNRLIKSIHKEAFSTYDIENFDLMDESDVTNGQKYSEKEYHGVMYQVIKLLNLSALSFANGGLYSNAAISYFSLVIIWNAFLEAIPYDDKYLKRILADSESKNVTSNSTQKQDNLDNEQEQYNNYKEIVKGEKIRKIRDKWVFEAQKNAFKHTVKSTGEANHHFMKSVLERNLVDSEIEKDSYFDREELRDRVLENKELLFQHFSMSGQVLAASIFWEEISADTLTNNGLDNTVNINKQLTLLKDATNELLPYGIRYYSIMLWLKGKTYLKSLLNEEKTSEGSSNKNGTSFQFSNELKTKAVNAIICLFRSSQYVIKTHGETSNMILPPLFIIYHNMWEVLFCLVDILNEETNVGNSGGYESVSFEQAVYNVRFQLNEQLRESSIRDVSSRVLDLVAVEQMALEQYKIVERMGDLSSSNRLDILRNKYYLDDDYEDNMFILDWSYCRFSAPSALVHRKIIEYKMRFLRNTFKMD